VRSRERWTRARPSPHEVQGRPRRDATAVAELTAVAAAPVVVGAEAGGDGEDFEGGAGREESIDDHSPIFFSQTYKEIEGVGILARNKGVKVADLNCPRERTDAWSLWQRCIKEFCFVFCDFCDFFRLGTGRDVLFAA
jgi:hypothetical protein